MKGTWGRIKEQREFIDPCALKTQVWLLGYQHGRDPLYLCVFLSISHPCSPLCWFNTRQACLSGDKGSQWHFPALVDLRAGDPRNKGYHHFQNPNPCTRNDMIDLAWFTCPLPEAIALPRRILIGTIRSLRGWGCPTWTTWTAHEGRGSLRDAGQRRRLLYNEHLYTISMAELKGHDTRSLRS